MKKLGLLIGANLFAAFAGAANIDALVLDKKGRPVADAIVAAKSISASTTDGKEISPKTQSAEIVQIKQEFVPYVTVLPVGAQVNFPNNDTVKHHVYSFSTTKKFDLPLYSGKSPSVQFDKPGVVVIGCNIHDWMIGYIYITDAPYFAKTDAQGKAVLKDLPAGKYTVHAWHPDNVGKEQSIQTDIGGSDHIKQDWHLDIKPRVNPRHNAMPDMNTY